MGLLVEDVAAAPKRHICWCSSFYFHNFLIHRVQDAWWVCDTNQQTLHHSQGCIFAVEISCETVSDVLWHIGSFWLWLGLDGFLDLSLRLYSFHANPSEEEGDEAKHGNHRNFCYARSQRASVSRCKANISVLSVLLVWKNLYTFAAEKSRQEKGKSKHGFLAQKVLDFR